MNDTIRQQAREAMKEQQLTQEEMGKRLGIPRTQINRMLISGENGIGKMPASWEKLAAELGMEIVMVPKQS